MRNVRFDWDATRGRRRLWPALLAMLTAGVVSAAAQQVARLPVAETGGLWAVESAERVADVKLAPLLGRDDALWMRNGTHVIRTDIDFTDGTIEFDLAPLVQGDFLAVLFRRKTLREQENLYIRLRRSGQFMALQYAPRLNGSSTWQLYPEFNATSTIHWPRKEWTHVRLEIRGSRLEVFVGNTSDPTLVIPRLRHGSTQGAVAFWARVNDKPQEWAAAVSRVSIRGATTAAAIQAPVPAADGYVARWDVAGPVAASEGNLAQLPTAIGEWQPVAAEESGLVNLTRLFPAQRGRFTAFGRVRLEATSEARIPLGVGYSDDVTVFLNGVPVSSGRNGWESRGPEYASFVDARFETVWLPLRAGQNELVLAVTDDQRFGWGFAARLEAAPGVRVAP